MKIKTIDIHEGQNEQSCKTDVSGSYLLEVAEKYISAYYGRRPNH